MRSLQNLLVMGHSHWGLDTRSFHPLELEWNVPKKPTVVCVLFYFGSTHDPVWGEKMEWSRLDWRGNIDYH